MNLTITAQDVYGNTATTYAGSHEPHLLAAPSASPGGNAADRRPTAAGTAVNFGTATAITFTAGVATVLERQKRRDEALPGRSGATISASDGTISTSARRLGVTVATAALSKFALGARNDDPGGGRRRRPDDHRPGHLREHGRPPTPAPTA